MSFLWIRYPWMRFSLVLFYAVLLYLIVFFLSKAPSNIGGLAAVTGFPVLYGMVVQSLIDPQVETSGLNNYYWGLLPIGVLIVILLFIGWETILCVAIAALPFLTLMGLGVWLARMILRRLSSRFGRNRLNASLVLIPLPLIPLLDSLSFPERNSVVVTEVIIPAPPSVVWSELVEISEIKESERIWTFSHNILNAPRPVDATVDRQIRQLRWTKGVRFQEHITERIEDRFLAWQFIFNEPETLTQLDPHISPDGPLVDLHSGFYRLKSMDNGSTHLQLETHYRLKTPLNSYLEIWGEALLQDFHRAVLAVVKVRSEQHSHDLGDFPG